MRMSKIQSAPKTKMTNSEFYNFCLLILNYLEAINLSVLLFKSSFDAFKARFNAYNDSLHKIGKADYDKKVIHMKKKLNASRTGLFNIISGLSVSQVDDIREAAMTLVDLIDRKYRNMSRLRYNDLLRMTLVLLDDLESEKYNTHIEKLNLKASVTALHTLYNECIDLDSKLIGVSGESKRLRRTVITRRELHVGYDRLVNQLNALAQVNGDAEYLELFTWWNALIDEYRRNISARTGAGTGGKSQTEASSQPDPNKGADKPDSGGGDDRPVIE